MNLIVDVQGFKTELNKFIPKEIALLNGNRVQTFLIRQPFPFYDLTVKEMKQVSWIERNRKVFWKEGFIPFSFYRYEIAPLLKNKLVYVKGLEKTKWIKEMFDNCNVVNIENKGCPNFNILYNLYGECNDVYTCIYHNNICALKNVICLNKWCIDNKVFNK